MKKKSSLFRLFYSLLYGMIVYIAKKFLLVAVRNRNIVLVEYNSTTINNFNLALLNNV